MDQDVALFINSSFAKGNTHETEMFKNGLLLPENDFNLQCIEVWGLEENALELSNLNFNNN